MAYLPSRLSSKLRIRHITKDHTLNVALDIIKKYRIGKSNQREENRLLNLESQIITLHRAAAPRMKKEGKELWLVKHPLCAGYFVSSEAALHSNSEC